MILTSDNHTVDLLPRHPAASPHSCHREPGAAGPGAPRHPHAPSRLTPRSAESRTPETETRPRHSAPIRIPITASPAKPGVAAQASSTPSPVSPYDPESRTTEAETHPRHPAPAPTQRWRPARPGYDFPFPTSSPRTLCEHASRPIDHADRASVLWPHPLPYRANASSAVS